MKLGGEVCELRRLLKKLTMEYFHIKAGVCCVQFNFKPRFVSGKSFLKGRGYNKGVELF